MKLKFKRITTTGERLGAFFIDHFIFSILFVIILIGLFIINMSLYENIIFLYIIFLLVAPLIFSLKDLVAGRSPGKRVFKIGVRCIDNPEEIPDSKRLFIRNITLILWPVEFFVMIFNSDRRRLGDKLANTIVVKLEKDTSSNGEDFKIFNRENADGNPNNKLVRIFIILSIIFILFPSLLVGGVFISMKSSGAYRTTISYIENNEDRFDIGYVEGYGFFPSGSVSTVNGSGEAEFKIKVKGSSKDIKIHSQLIKEPESEWKIINFEVLD